nr:testis-specific serine/threonine-protein kinase 1 [Oryctolagus cuniculus]
MEGLTAFSSEEEVLDGYQVLRVLGQGGFGLVMLAYHWESRTQVAVKVVENGGQHSCSFQQLCTEAEIMKGLHHPHIIQLLQVRHTTERGYIFMEYAVRGDLRCYMVERGYLLDGEIRQLLKQILSAVHYCHSQHVVHRDLKLENLLLDAHLNIKLSDFGLSCKLAGGERLKSLCGTFAYCAPEEFLGEEFCGYKADAWSVGVILYAMVAGSLPFVGEDCVELRAAILSGYYRIPHYGNPELCNLVDSLLTRDPEARPTVADIMGHPWLHAGHGAPGTSDEFLFLPQEQEVWEFPWGLCPPLWLHEWDDPWPPVPRWGISQQQGFSIPEIHGRSQVEPAAPPQGPEALSSLEDLGFQLGHQAGSLPPRLPASALCPGLQQDHSKGKPTPQAIPGAQSCPALQCLQGHSGCNSRARECAALSSQPLVLAGDQSGQTPFRGTPSVSISESCRTDSPQRAVWTRSPAACAVLSQDALTSLSTTLSTNSSGADGEVRSCSPGASEEQSIPGMQQQEEEQEAGTTDRQARKGKGRLGIGRRIIQCFSWMCCVLPAPEESP